MSRKANEIVFRNQLQGQTMMHIDRIQTEAIVRGLAALLISVTLVGCGRKTNEQPRTLAAPAAVPATPADPAASAPPATAVSPTPSTPSGARTIDDSFG